MGSYVGWVWSLILGLGYNFGLAMVGYVKICIARYGVCNDGMCLVGCGYRGMYLVCIGYVLSRVCSDGYGLCI